MNNLQKRILTTLIVLPLSIFFVIKGGYFLSFFLIFILFAGMYELFSTFKKIKSILFLSLILALSLFSAYYLRESIIIGALLIYFAIAVSISSDIGGYVFGKVFKWKKLTKISPNKTISGLIGSFLFSLTLVPFIYKYLGNINLFSLIFIVIIISLTTQLGDLFISYLKRKAKVKDTSNILPGHGGFLDRIDGIIFAIPVGILLFNYI